MNKKKESLDFFFKKCLNLRDLSKLKTIKMFIVNQSGFFMTLFLTNQTANVYKLWRQSLVEKINKYIFHNKSCVISIVITAWNYFHNVSLLDTLYIKLRYKEFTHWHFFKQASDND